MKNSQLKLIGLTTILTTILCSCNWFSRGSDMIDLSAQVLDEDQGVKIVVEPMKEKG